MTLGSKYVRLAFTLIVISIFVFLAYSGYCYYDEPNEDGYCAILMRGDFSGAPQILPNSSGFWVGLTYCLRVFFRWEPDVDWYGVFDALAYCLLLFQVSQILPVLFQGLKKVAGKWFAVITLCCSAVLLAENLLLWQFTAVALLLSGLSLFKIWLNLNSGEKPALYRLGAYIFNVFCFAYAACIRSEAATLNIVLWMPLMFLDYTRGMAFRKYTAFILPILIIAAISLAVNIPANQADMNYLAFRKYQFSFFDYKQPVNTLSLANTQDSMCYTAISTAFMSDSAKINTAFFKRIGLLPMDKTPAAIPYYLRNIASGPGKINRACIKLLRDYPGLTLFYFFFFGGGLLFVYSSARPKMFWYVTSQLWPVFLFLGITTFMKMENRVLVPVIWCALVQNVLWCYLLADEKHISSKPANTLALVVFIVALVSVKLDAAKLYNRWNSIKHEENQTGKLVRQINSRSEKIIAVNDNACGRLCIRPFKPRYAFKDKQIICLNYFQLFWLAGYGPYMQSVCGKSDLPGIVQALQQRKNEVIFVSKGSRMELIKDYFKVEYNMNLPYSPVDSNITITRGKNSDINLYRFI